MPKAVTKEQTGTNEQDTSTSWHKMNYFKRYWISFKGLDKEAGDYWLPYFIGVVEVLAYPILFHFEQVTVIGGWIALKTAGNWGVWKERRPPLYNFLWGNIITILISYFLMTDFIGP